MSVSRRVIAVGMVLYGALMLAASPAVYSSTTYTVLFALAGHVGAPLDVWGVVWIATGIAGLTLKERGPLVMVGCMWVWSVGLWNAVWAGKAQTWGGPIWPTLIAILLSLNIARHTIR